MGDEWKQASMNETSLFELFLGRGERSEVKKAKNARETKTKKGLFSPFPPSFLFFIKFM